MLGVWCLGYGSYFPVQILLSRKACSAFEAILQSLLLGLRARQWPACGAFCEGSFNAAENLPVLILTA
ncbi:MAG: hypothetical protein K6U14_09705 [Firmicutes bacterium]|nr:hypothetical protein [Alicyclobacillaceae bacterium]MCL6497887.1 hypothetical protein [Bacillota bacterium]